MLPALLTLPTVLIALMTMPCPAGEGEEEGAACMGDSDVEVLNQRLAEARRRGDGAAAAVAASEAAAPEAAASRAEEEADAAPSFLRSTDEEFAASLAERISEVASALGSAGASADSGDDGEEVDDGASLTGPLLRELMETKWGKAYDLSFVR